MITYGQVKDELAALTDNGITAADPRMIPFVNAAMRALANAMQPRGIFVGSTMSAVVAIDSSKTFRLPPEMDVVHNLELMSGTTPEPLPNGWYNIVSANVLVDPDDIFDNAIVDAGTDGTGIRSYSLPELAGGVQQVIVYGLKKYVPVVDDSTPLFIPNIEAIKWWLLSMFKGQTQDDRAAARDLRALAVEELTNELSRHLDDPQRYAARLARWRLDEVGYEAGTIGNIAARMALDFGNGQKIGRIKLYRMVNEAAREAVQMFNSLGRMDRYSNATGPNQITFVRAVAPGDMLSYGDYEALLYLVKAQGPTLKPEEQASGKQAAMDVITRNLLTQVDAARSSARYARLSLPVTSLGYLTARIGLEVPDQSSALALSDNQLRRLVNEAARESLQQRNFLGRSERYSNAFGHEEVPFSYASVDADIVSYPDLEVLRRLVGAQLVTNQETARGLRAEVGDLVERNLQKWIEAKRNDVWHCLIRNTPFPQFGGARGQIGLEYGGDGGADGYKLSDAYLARMVQQAWSKAVDHFNFLSRTEDYEQPLLPAPPATPADTAVIPFPLEIIKTYTEALLVQDKNEAERATGYTAAASALIQRNLVGLVERTRRVTAEAQVLTDKNSFGYIKGRLALELPNGLAMSDAKRGRLVNEAEELLSNSGRWKFMEGQFILAVAANGRVVVPLDVEAIIYAEICGQPVELQDRKWFYTGFVTRNGLGYDGWNFRAELPLIYAGPDGCGNANYTLGSGCGYAFNAAVRPPLRALCRRKWLLKTTDSAPMLIQNYPAIKSMIESLLYRQAGDAGNAEYKKNSALKALDNQLGVETEGQVANVTVRFPGLPRGGTTRRAGGWGGTCY